MANYKYTISLDGDTSELQKQLKDVWKQIGSINASIGLTIDGKDVTKKVNDIWGKISQSLEKDTINLSDLVDFGDTISKLDETDETIKTVKGSMGLLLNVVKELGKEKLSDTFTPLINKIDTLIDKLDSLVDKMDGVSIGSEKSEEQHHKDTEKFLDDEERKQKAIEATRETENKGKTPAKTQSNIKNDYSTKNKTEAYKQLEKAADEFKKYWGDEAKMASEEGTRAAHAYYKAYEEAVKKEVADSRLEKVTIDTDKYYSAQDIVYKRKKQYEEQKRYGREEPTDIAQEIVALENKLKDFDYAYSVVKEHLGESPITSEIISDIERYVELLDKARSLEELNDPEDQDIIKSHKYFANSALEDALYKADTEKFKRNQPASEYTKVIKELESSLFNSKKDLASQNGYITSLLFGEDGNIKSDVQLLEEVNSEIRSVIETFSNGEHSTSEWINTLQDALEKYHIGQSFGIIGYDQLDSFSESLFQEFLKSNTSANQQHDSLSDDYFGIMGSAIDKQSQLNSIRELGEEKYLSLLQERKRLTDQIATFSQSSAGNLDPRTLQSTHEEAEIQIAALAEEKSTIEDLIEKLNLFKEESKNAFTNSWEIDRSVQQLTVLKENIESDIEAYKSFEAVQERMARCQESKIFEDFTNTKVSSNNNTPKELELYCEELDSKLFEGSISGQEAIEKFNEKAKELGVTFDEDAQKWIKLVSSERKPVKTAPTIKNAVVNDSSTTEQQNKLQEELKETQQQAEETSKSILKTKEELRAQLLSISSETGSINSTDISSVLGLDKDFVNKDFVKLAFGDYTPEQIIDYFLKFYEETEDASTSVSKLQEGLKETENQANKTAEAESTAMEEVATKTDKATESQERFNEAQGRAASSMADYLDQIDREIHAYDPSALKGRDIVSQGGLKETYWETDKQGVSHEKGMFSFVERLQDGQLQNVLVKYDEETQQWYENVVSLSTAFEKVGNEIVSLDNQIAKYEMNKDKQKSSNPTYDTSADEKLIKLATDRQAVLLETLQTYSDEEEYAYEISEFEKKRLQNQERLNALKQKQSNELQARQDTKNNNQAIKEAEKLTKNSQLRIQTLNTSLEETDKLLAGLSMPKELSNEFKSLLDKVEQLNTDLINGEILPKQYASEIKSATKEYNSKVSIQQDREYQEYLANPESKMRAIDSELEKTDRILAGLDMPEALSADFKQLLSDVDILNQKLQKGIVQIGSYRSGVETLAGKYSDKATSQPDREAAILNTEDRLSKTSKSGDWDELVNKLAKLNEQIFNGELGLDSYNKKIDSVFSNYEKKAQSATDTLNSTISNFHKGIDNLNYSSLLGDQVEAQKNELATLDQEVREGTRTLNQYKAEAQQIVDTLKDWSKLGRSDVGKTGINTLAEAQTAIQEYINKVGTLKGAIKGTDVADASGITTWTAQVVTASGEVQNLAFKWSESAHTLITTSSTVRTELTGVAKAWDALKKKTSDLILYWTANFANPYQIIGGFRKVINVATELDTAMVEVIKVSDETDEAYNNFSNTIAASAKKIASTNKELTTSAASYLRLGYNIKQAAQLAENTAVFVNVGDGIDIDTATEDMITAMKAFDIQAEESMKIIDSYNSIGKLIA